MSEHIEGRMLHWKAHPAPDDDKFYLGKIQCAARHPVTGAVKTYWYAVGRESHATTTNPLLYFLTTLDFIAHHMTFEYRAAEREKAHNEWLGRLAKDRRQ